ncbi:ALK-EXO [Urbanus proteus nucleopolyhedrovirus]|uniref:ALK-EXO n=1 Tax=Urbanus proteus nucleopolyhedrovirus TaxID=1675866 RepID=A0A162GU42_9ABAC|nr:ALK-EXO [Urbanus proteus nucleopolyhedrovirus]AKR17319.1 ALK-EXO [Urbanus proteus nucleopolyhedrovirus]
MNQDIHMFYENCKNENDDINEDHKRYLEKFYYANFVSNLTNINQRVSKSDIETVERITRGQCTNKLWEMLRLNRHTASGGKNVQNTLPESAAMTFGIVQENCMKHETSLFDLLKSCVENELICKIKHVQLECGMFLSSMGLYSASPDAYFVTDSDAIIPIEIKCPYTYHSKSVQDIRDEMKSRKSRYRIKHTAYSVNKTGDPLYIVEKKDPHYRQIQRQIYVLNAQVAVYIVKFKNSYVAHLVYRDQEFFDAELKKELAVLKTFVDQNRNKDYLYKQSYRIKTFDNASLTSIDKSTILTLTKLGMYHNYGVIECVFCNQTVDSTTENWQIVYDAHEKCKKNPRNIITLVNAYPQYADYNKRFETLLAAVDDKRDAAYAARCGLFYNFEHEQFVMFCCGWCDMKLFNAHHNECDYAMMLNNAT